MKSAAALFLCVVAFFLAHGQWLGFEPNENRPERHLRVRKIFCITIINEPLISKLNNFVRRFMDPVRGGGGGRGVDSA